MTTQRPALDNGRLRGVLPVLPVPFADDGAVDQAGLARIATFAIERGAIGLAFGFASEYFRLTERERETVVAVAVKSAQGQVPVIAPCTGESVEAVRQMVRRAQALGASLALVNPPSVIRPDPQQLQHFFAQIADEGLSLMIQDAPHLTGVELSVSLLGELATIPGVTHLKIEAVPTWVKAHQLRQHLGDRIGLFGGFGGLYLFPELLAGMDGVMPSAAHPQIYRRLMDAFWGGRRDEAEQQYQRVLPYLIASSSSLDDHVWLQKEMLLRLGVIAHNHLRTPARQPDPFAAEMALELASRLGVFDTSSS